ncbi:MAG: single-stranded DNA-binding protein [Firmicutes bacterium]|nr:single-stranded DNA-binding protein [Bacillota bacterium]
MALNNCVLSGYLYWPFDRDSKTSPENGTLGTSQAGNKFVRFSLRTDSLRKGDDGKFKKMNLDCIAYSNTAEQLVKNFKKGSPIEIVGRLDQDVYEDKEGTKRTKTTIVVDRFNFPPKEWENGATRTLPGEPKKRSDEPPFPGEWVSDDENPFDDDDIPF